MTTTPVAASPLPLEGADASGPAKPDPRRLLGWWAARVALAFAAWVGAAPSTAQERSAVTVQVEDPRAFGHLVGDELTRRVVLDVPRHLKLAESSLPSPGRIGQSFELRAVDHQSRPTFSGTRHTLALRYQVFRAPREPVVLDLPTFTLRFDPQAPDQRGESLRIDFAPVGMVPLMPSDPVLRAGFGTLRPDVPAPAVDTRPERLRLAGYGVAALLPLGYLAFIYLGGPWWQRRQRPFALAQRQLRELPVEAAPTEWLAAWRRVHAALDATASEVLHPGVLDRWLERNPRYRALRGELAWFFDRSQAIFFADEAPQAADRQRLRELCRRCFDAERGLA